MAFDASPPRRSPQADLSRYPFPSALRSAGSLGVGLLVCVLLGVAAVPAARYLGLGFAQLELDGQSWALAGDFLSAAWRPALDFQGSYAPDQTLGVVRQALRGASLTVVFAAAAVSLALPLGLFLGLLGSTAWWDGTRVGGRVGPLVTIGVRSLVTLMRSVHELAWAVLLLAALGSGNLVAVVAMAIPYTGTLAKVYAEMLDEVPRDTGSALFAAGAGPWQAFLFGQLPQAAPDMLAFALYRFECALRSSAVLGFFGFPTLGYYLAASFENLHYGEVWTYLYFLMALVVLVDWWSGRLRREMGT